MTTATAQAILLIALAVLAVDTLVLMALVFLYITRGSPLGWEDRGGFHYDGEGSTPYGGGK